MSKIVHYLSSGLITNKDIIVRVDYNISLGKDHNLGNLERIKQSLPTLKLLLKDHNRLLLISHLGKPKRREASLSLKPIAKALEKLLPGQSIKLAADLDEVQTLRKTQSSKEIILLENIRFFPGEQENYPTFATRLAKLGETYVNDAFSVSHRNAASVVLLPKILPSYGGLLLQKETQTLEKLLTKPRRPFVAVLGGAKVSDKIKLLTKIVALADSVLIGGGMANTFLRALGVEIGKSFFEPDSLGAARRIVSYCEQHQTNLVLPQDATTAGSLQSKNTQTKLLSEINKSDVIGDIGPETEANFAQVLSKAGTIVWNGPVGYFENPHFRHGTDFLYYAISANPDAFSVLGGGETLAAVSKKEHLDHIAHISTGGGAMLEFLEQGSLPGIEALKR